MTATESKLQDFFAQSKTRFVIPIYQRNYDWTAAQVDSLLADIRRIGRLSMEAAGENGVAHFIGSIVFLHNGLYHSAPTKELEIIDGQQRLTTVSLIYATLYRLALEQRRQELATELLELYLHNRFASDGKEKLTLTSNNAEVYRQILTDSLPSTTQTYSRLRENYTHLRERILPEDIEVVRRGLDRLVFVEISLERGKDDPQRIFESLNSTGLELTQADLIRNYVLMGYARDEQERLFQAYWEPIERYTRQRDSAHARVSDFVRDYLTLKTKQIPNKSQVYEGFKAFMAAQQQRGQTASEVLSDLRRYAEHYSHLIKPETVSDAELQRELKFVDLLEVNTATPFLLQVLDDRSSGLIDRMTLMQVIHLIQTFIWRRIVANVPTNALNRIFASLYDSVEPEEYYDSIAVALTQKRGSGRFPRDSEFKQQTRDRDFYHMKGKNRNYLFEKLENFNNREFVEVAGLTVEHIFPQTPGRGWREALEEAEYRNFQEVFLHRIGNLTLSGNNGSLGNRPFVEKRELNTGGGGEQGYRYSRLWLNRDLRDLDRWSSTEFEIRTRRMVDRMLDIWPYPEVAEEETQDASTSMVGVLLPVEELEEVTGANIVDARIFGLHTGPITFADLYRRSLTALYERDAYRLRDAEILSILGAKREANETRRPFEVAERYYVDMNLNAQDIVNQLSKVVVAMGVEGEIEVGVG